MLCHGSTSPSTLASAPPLSTPLFLEEEEAGGRDGRRGGEDRDKKRRSAEVRRGGTSARDGAPTGSRCTDRRVAYATSTVAVG